MDSRVKRLQQLREEQGITLQEQADAVDIPEQFLTMFELGEMVPSEPQMARIRQYILDKIS